MIPRALLVLLLTLVVSALRAEVRVERMLLPEGATPGSFAVALPGGVNFCYDPARGGLRYVWIGGFLDLAPARPGPAKFIAAARLLGPVVHREDGLAPLRRGRPETAPALVFTGYTLRPAAIEFRYTLDGVPVREELSARPDGRGLVRRFLPEAGSDARWWHVTEDRPPAALGRDAAGALILEVSWEGAP
jgi:hypothetical protein